jgi:hypothetical protein
VGDGDAVGRDSAGEQPEEIRVRMTRRKVIHRFPNIVIPFE